MLPNAEDDDGEDLHLPLDEAVPLAEFLRDREPLTIDECLRLVEQAIVLLDQIYVHLPAKRAMYAVDPVRRLKLLEHRLRQLQGSTSRRKRAPDDLWFHREMTDIFTSVRDLHTVYLLPSPFAQAVAFLPFQVEDFFVGRERRYMVSNVILDLSWFTPPEDFRPGVEVTHFNGVPIERAVELAGRNNAGSNPEARHARGLARLTIRPLAKSVPPDEEWITLRYRRRAGATPRELRIDWRVAILPEDAPAPRDGMPLREAMGRGIDVETDMIRNVKKRMWVPEVIKEERRLARPRARRIEREERVSRDGEERVIATDLPGILQARTRRVDGVEYGYIRIRSFVVEDRDLFHDEFIELLERMPPNGLIIDVRDNSGGYIESGERLLQLLTPRTIEPERLQFINTPLNLRFCELYDDLQPWVPSMRRAIETGSTFSASFPHSSFELCNSTGQRYYGPVLLVTNGLCYSTTDIFAAGFQDHEIGPILGVDRNTGAGGANVVSHVDLRGMLVDQRGRKLPDSPFERLPRNADLRVAIRRTLRVGLRAGTELEDIGVVPDIPYRMTRNDILNGNIDLITTAARILATLPSYDLRHDRLRRSRRNLTLELRTRNLDRLDMSVDGWSSRPSSSITDGVHKIELEAVPSGARLLELRGYKGGKLAAARKIWLG